MDRSVPRCRPDRGREKRMSLSTARLIVSALLVGWVTVASGVDHELRKVPNPRPAITDARVLQTNCDPATIKEFFEPATAEAPEVRLGCSLALKAGQTLTKRIVFRGKGASGATLDCGGSTILPTFYQHTYEIPAITIQSNSGKAPDG